MKFAYKAIDCEDWPSINHIEIETAGRTLRNSNDLKLMPSMIKGTFQDLASKELDRSNSVTI